MCDYPVGILYDKHTPIKPRKKDYKNWYSRCKRNLLKGLAWPEMWESELIFNLMVLVAVLIEERDARRKKDASE